MSKPKNRKVLFLNDDLIAAWQIWKDGGDPYLKFYGHDEIVSIYLGDYGEHKKQTESLEKLICFLEELRDKIDPDQA